MTIDSQLLDQVLSTPADRDVTGSPIVRAIILVDVENAALLAPPLQQNDSLAALNARRILALFGPAAVPPLLAALIPLNASARKEGVEALFSMLVGEESWSIRDALSAGKSDLNLLLDDKEILPDTMPDYVERDFAGRVCDFTYIVIQQLIDANFDQSLFRSYDNQQRDEAIRRLKGSDFGLRVV